MGKINYRTDDINKKLKQIDELVINNNSLENRLNNIKLQLNEKAHKTYVTYKEFGAILDGVNDDSQAIINCHKYANENNLDIKQIGGKVLCNFSVDVKTNCYLDVEFIINDSTPYTVYWIKSDNESDVIWEGTFSDNQINGFNDIFKGKFFVPRLDNDNWRLGVKDRDGETEIYYHRQPIAVDKTGALISSPIYKGNQGKFTLRYYKDITENGIIFSGGTVITNISSIGFPRLIRINRNNCTVKNITIDNKGYPIMQESYASGLICVEGCCNTTIENINGINNSISNKTLNSYIIDITDSYNVNIDKCNLSQGWGVMASHFVDTLNITNSVINRVDNHYGIFGCMNINNINLTGIATINLGYGNGKVNFTNSIVHNTISTSSIIITRNDFNITYSGTIMIDNVDFSKSTVNRIMEYKVGSGTANESLSVGKILIVARNLIEAYKTIILNYTSFVIELRVYNCEIIPCNSNNIVNYIAYNSILRNIVSTGTVSLYNCKIMSFNPTAVPNYINIIGGEISTTIDIETLVIYCSGCNLTKNINNAKKVVMAGCYGTGGRTVTVATEGGTKNIQGCINII